MVIAVIAVWVVQVTIDQVVDVVAMRYGGVAAARAVGVIRRVTRTAVLRGARGRVSRVDLEDVLVEVPVVRVVEVTVVEVVDVVPVADRRVAAARAVDVVVRVVDVVAHALSSRAGLCPASFA